MLIDLVQLRTFVAVAEEQHLTRASERLHISQSAASAHVRSVEDALGAVLFIRTNRTLELTHAGKLLLKKARHLLNEASVFTSYAREIGGQVTGNLIVGASSDPTVTRVGSIVSQLRQRYPFINVDLRALPSSAAKEGLKNTELDAGIFLGRPTDSLLSYQSLANFRFLIAGPAAWEAQIKAADIAKLASMPWITPSDAHMAYSVMLDQMFGDVGLELNSVALFDNEAIGRSMVHAGVGLMLLREEHALRGEADGSLVVSRIVEAEFSLFLAHLKSRSTDPLILSFKDAALAAWGLASPKR